ncbi:hypothetical protein KOW79_019771 [Hemibagrus wyckioides]|uniref:Fatty acid-binding protein, brain n=1 Tax=Hemibagrus wyckioides TaxID=337641 RepID=A0A9D3N829_9TELE|nr:hypothetical protein KOW79_019771 [Hemibagrus wyckioides]
MGSVMDFFAALGVVSGTSVRQLLVTQASQDGDYIVMKIKMFEAINRTFTLTFKLGEEFDESTIDFRVCKSVLNLEGGKLIHLQKWDGKEATTISEIQDGKLIITFILGDIVSVRTYERI